MTKPDMLVATYRPLIVLPVNNYSSVDVLIIGAGPTGLGAAKRLNQLVRVQCCNNWLAKLIQHAGWAIMDDHRLQ
jgi:hypothetical protein